MLSVWQSVLIILGTVVLSLVFLAVLRRVWPVTRRTEHNDIIGWQISVLGTTYAVILAFMLWNVWNNFQTARINAEMEANLLVDLYRIAGGLEPAQGKPIRALCREYAVVTVNEEWPAMAQEKLSAHSFSTTQQMWEVLLQAHSDAGVTDVLQQSKYEQAFSTLSQMSEHRRLRQLESRMKLPGILWAVLVVGGIVVIGSACLFGCQNFTLHFVLVFVLSLLLSLVLVSVAEIDRPFQGPVHVRADAFEFAQQTFAQLPQ
ncbi:MAG TPA: hypothetical protein VKS00_07065 [Candidatus Acidoferrales bacterium]|nr:hypothetical protein [Candidatus Acidoferrales bacterium]